MLVVGHNCPGCGLDTPSIACEACGADVVWDRESGSHCSTCGLSASTITCPECGLRAELDKCPPEPVAHEPALRMSPDEDTAPEPPPALHSRFATALASAPPMRTLLFGAAVGLHGLVIALLLGAPYGDRPAPRGDIALARIVAAPTSDRLTRGVVDLSLDAKPVPLPPRPPGAEPPPMPEPRLELSPPPVVVTRLDTGPRPAPRNEGWLQRVLRSGRAYSPASDRFPADAAGIGR